MLESNFTLDSEKIEKKGRKEREGKRKKGKNKEGRKEERKRDLEKSYVFSLRPLSSEFCEYECRMKKCVLHLVSRLRIWKTFTF